MKIVLPTIDALHSLITQTLRSDRVSAAAGAYVQSVLGEEFMSDAEQEMDFGEIVEREIKASTFT